ncbi:uncharacterized protein AMSG_07222 [Thecamonas trahens ATCC 50062]|uniref:Uncharacterized protein n=1 Tax=Thecamonas trahens ATCC 50062 TaxID=461836 RepID=A0A0L0DF46_THETB|nr:hypothetical protein AMSG_07222 [Thecamonas trahens ATCC 50062]KNC50967.1 hypothetical protein AMSG_07222 [Thecamonas trahens ATCC 50062]|eukprot:XP_013756663.1 hypothetical protein AMSG_07222 [Thecamonas trahens ATCC 50062]
MAVGARSRPWVWSPRDEAAEPEPAYHEYPAGGTGAAAGYAHDQTPGHGYSYSPYAATQSPSPYPAASPYAARDPYAASDGPAGGGNPAFLGTAAYAGAGATLGANQTAASYHGYTQQTPAAALTASPYGQGYGQDYAGGYGQGYAGGYGQGYAGGYDQGYAQGYGYEPYGATGGGGAVLGAPTAGAATGAATVGSYSQGASPLLASMRGGSNTRPRLGADEPSYSDSDDEPEPMARGPALHAVASTTGFDASTASADKLPMAAVYHSPYAPQAATAPPKPTSIKELIRRNAAVQKVGTQKRRGRAPKARGGKKKGKKR